MHLVGAVMATEVEGGMTYPQESMPADAFESYFFSGDVFLAISHSGNTGGSEGTETPLTIEEARQGRAWQESVAGYYYVQIVCFSVPRTKFKARPGQTQLSRTIVACMYFRS